MKAEILPTLAILFIGITSFTYPAPDTLENKAVQKEKTIHWISIEEAEKLTKENPRKIFVDVYTDWCGWCKRMDATTFRDEKVVDYVNEHYYAVKLDAESQDNIALKGLNTTGAALARSFRVSAYPTIVFIDETFSQIMPIPGFRKAEEFIDILRQYNEGPAK